MKVIYIGCSLLQKKKLGVINKLKSQFSEIKYNCPDSELVVFCEPSVAKTFNFDGVDVIECKRRGIIAQIEFIIKFRRKCDAIFSLNDANTILLCRMPPLGLIFPNSFFKKIRSSKVVVEYNNMPDILNRNNLFILEYCLNKIFGPIIVKQADGIVGVTDEIVQKQLELAEGKSIKNITIGNGITTSCVREKKFCSFDGTHLNMITVGDIRDVMAIDRLLLGMAQYEGQVKIHLHIAGEGKSIRNLIEMSRKLNINNNVTFHGVLQNSELNALFDICHIGMGALGPKRNNLTETTALKVREYCARGCPFVLVGKDPDLDPNFSFCLRLSDNEEPIEINKIIDFLHDLNDNPNYQHEIRSYAVSNLDWAVKMKKLCDFLQTILL